jgi:hypothetical protein
MSEELGPEEDDATSGDVPAEADAAAGGTVAPAGPAGLKAEIDRWHVRATREEADRAQRRREERLAKPTAAVRIRLAGTVTGTIEQDMALTVTTETDASGEEVMVVVVEPVDPIALAGHVFEGFSVAVPEYTGPGRYDLNALADLDAFRGWDPAWFELLVDPDVSEGWRWRPEHGPAAVEVTDGERTIEVAVVFQEPTGDRIELTATITRP